MRKSLIIAACVLTLAAAGRAHATTYLHQDSFDTTSGGQSGDFDLGSPVISAPSSTLYLWSIVTAQGGGDVCYLADDTYVSAGSGHNSGAINEYSDSGYSILVNSYFTESIKDGSTDLSQGIFNATTNEYKNSVNGAGTWIMAFHEIPMVAGHYYRWHFDCDPVGADNSATVTFEYNSAVSQPYFILNNEYFPPPDVSMAFPTNGSTTPNFTNWVVSVINRYSSMGRVGVDYGLSSSSLIYSDSRVFAPFVETNPVAIYKSQPLWFPPLLAPAQWWVRPWVSSGTDRINGTLEYFYIDPNQAAPAASTSTNLAGPFLNALGQEVSSTLLNATLNCQSTTSSFLSDPVGNIQYGICNALNFLFIPSNSEQQSLEMVASTTYNLIKSKPPFGYITAIKADFDNLTDTTTSVSTGGISVRLIPGLMDGIDAMLATALGLLGVVALYILIHNFEP